VASERCSAAARRSAARLRDRDCGAGRRDSRARPRFASSRRETATTPSDRPLDRHRCSSRRSALLPNRVPTGLGQGSDRVRRGSLRVPRTRLSSARTRFGGRRNRVLAVRNPFLDRELDATAAFEYQPLAAGSTPPAWIRLPGAQLGVEPFRGLSGPSVNSAAISMPDSIDESEGNAPWPRRGIRLGEHQSPGAGGSGTSRPGRRRGPQKSNHNER
jgi:hypothetical protein